MDAALDPTPLTLQQLEHHQRLFVSVAESGAAATARRQLQFSPSILLIVPPILEGWRLLRIG